MRAPRAVFHAADDLGAASAPKWARGAQVVGGDFLNTARVGRVGCFRDRRHFVNAAEGAQQRALVLALAVLGFSGGEIPGPRN